MARARDARRLGGALAIWLATTIAATASTAPAFAEAPAGEPPSERGHAGLELAWQAPAECPDVADVRARIARRTGAPADRASDGGSVSIAITREGEAFVAHIDLGGLGGLGGVGGLGGFGAGAAGALGGGAAGDHRTLTSARCDDLADAAAMIVAAAEGERLASADEPAPHAAVAIVRAAPVAVDATWRFGARASTLAAVGLLPGYGIGGELVAFAQRGPLIAELGASKWATSSTMASADSADRIGVALTAATARAGWQLAGAPLRAWVVVDVGRMSAADATATTTLTGAGSWAAAGVGGALHLQVTRAFAAVIAVEALATLDRQLFVTTVDDTRYEAKRVTARGSLGLEVGW